MCPEHPAVKIKTRTRKNKKSWEGYKNTVQTLPVKGREGVGVLDRDHDKILTRNDILLIN